MEKFTYTMGFYPAKEIPPGWSPEDKRDFADSLERESMTNKKEYSPDDRLRFLARITQLRRSADRQEADQAGLTIAIIDPFSFGELPDEDLQIAEWQRVAAMLSSLPKLSPMIPLTEELAIRIPVETIGPENLWSENKRPGTHPFLLAPDGEITTSVEPLEEINHGHFVSLAVAASCLHNHIVAAGRIEILGGRRIKAVTNQCSTFMSPSHTLPPVMAVLKFWGADITGTALRKIE